MHDGGRRLLSLLIAPVATVLFLLLLTGVAAPGLLPSGGMPVAEASLAASPAAPAAGVTFTVTTTADAGAGSLREAIQQANATPGDADTIIFAIGNPNLAIPVVINLASALPTINTPMTIRGPNAGAGQAPIVLDGNGGDYRGLNIGNAAVTVRGLTVREFGQVGIWVQDNASGVLIAGCTVTDNGGPGVGGGMYIRDSAGVVVGGDTAADRNVISGNWMNGLMIYGGGGNVVKGNYIGVSASGTVSDGNANSGVALQHTSNNTVGGSTAGRRNVIAGNDIGISIYGEDCTGNFVQGNYIGTDASGTNALGNDRYGIQVQSTLSTTIGGSAAGQGNLISGNGNTGIDVIRVDSIIPPTGTVILGNRIGTNAAGTAALPNGYDGIHIVGGGGHVIGGAAGGAGNIISGNDNHGIFLQSATDDSAKPFVTVKGNRIGVDATGVAPLGNAGQGIRLETADVTVGGIGAGEGNVIAYNGLQGVIVFNDRNAIRGNSIYANGRLGIDLSPGNAVNPNDPGDADEGANRGQNYPDILNVARGGSTITVTGRLVTTATTLFALDFYAGAACDATGYGEGQMYLASRTLTITQADMPFTTAITGAPPELPYLTATATDPEGNTSEFSACFLTVNRSSVYMPLVAR